MKTARLDVLEQARELWRRMDALRDNPVTLEFFPVISGYDAETHIAWNRERDREEPRDRVERELREQGKQ